MKRYTEILMQVYQLFQSLHKRKVVVWLRETKVHSIQKEASRLLLERVPVKTLASFGGNQACCMDRPPTLLCLTESKNLVSLSDFFLPDLNEPVRGGTSRSPMVVVRPTFPLFSHNAKAKWLYSDRIRCLQVKMGDKFVRKRYVANRGHVDIRGGRVPHQ